MKEEEKEKTTGNTLNKFIKHQTFKKDVIHGIQRLLSKLQSNFR